MHNLFDEELVSASLLANTFSFFSFNSLQISLQGENAPTFPVILDFRNLVLCQLHWLLTLTA